MQWCSILDVIRSPRKVFQICPTNLSQKQIERDEVETHIWQDKMMFETHRCPLTKLGEVVDVASEEGQLALVDVHELVVKRVHHSLVQVELLHIVASVKGTFKGTIENESERNGKYFQTVKKILKHYHSQSLPTLAQLERATSPVSLFLKW